jgi:hypothetical protein
VRLVRLLVLGRAVLLERGEGEALSSFSLTA